MACNFLRLAYFFPTMSKLRSLLICFIFLGSFAARADWPDFRGPWEDGDACAPGNTNLLGLPLQWSETSHVKWKMPIHDRGWSTPVILGKQIWLTTATEDGHDFYAVCVDADTGKILSDQKLFHSDNPEPLGNDVNCYASPSPILEPGRVYVHFGSYGTACLDTKSFKVLWKRDDIPCRHYRGPASSPVIFENLLILTLDGIDLQYLIALDKKTGKTIWKTDRTAQWNDLNQDGKPVNGGDLRKGFSTPLFVKLNGKTVMFSLGSKAAYCYDPATGKEIWKIRHSGHSGASRPLYKNGVVFIATGNGKGEMLAAHAEGGGDVTDTGVIWRMTKGAPHMVSPVLAGDLLFMLNEGGIVTCVESATGKVLWQERVPGDYYSSLLYGDGRIYCFNRDGVATVLKAARNYEVLATNRLNDGFMACPAIAGKDLILRTKTDLYRISGE